MTLTRSTPAIGDLDGANLYCSRDPYRAHEHVLKIRHPGGF